MRRLTRLKKNLVNRSERLRYVQRYLYKFKPYAWKFRAYYLDNGWNNTESRSGSGSTLSATKDIREHLPHIFERYGIQTMVDIPCGDFNWMKEVDLSQLRYYGYDIVPELIADNIANYQTDSVHFGCLDLVKQTVPQADLILCRDCLFHYTNTLILKMLRNIKNSGSAYLLTTTFTAIPLNQEIDAIGLFRPINLERPPFNMPAPLCILKENQHQDKGKSLGLWDLKTLII